mgnify:CR=1 FL=1
MKKVIIYPKEDNSLGLVHPALNAITAFQAGRKIVPKGTPFKVLNLEDLPADTSFIDAWEADFSEPDGYGIGIEEWFAEQDADASIGDPEIYPEVTPIPETTE